MALCCYSGDKFSVDKVRRRLKEALWLIDHYTWLVDAYMSDFFVHRISSRVPRDWWDVLLAMEPPEMADMLKPQICQTRRVWPLSLLAFHSSVHSISLSNQPVPVDKALCEQLLNHPKFTQVVVRDGCHGNGRTQPQVNGDKAARGHCAELTQSERNDVKQRVVSVPVSAHMKDGQLLQLDHCYRRHVKPKKQHEITTLAPLLKDLCQTCHCQSVVDVGAGQGHLSRLLSFGYDLNVTTVESAGCHAPKAAKFDGEVKDDIRKERFHHNKKKLSACEDLSEDQMSRSPHHIVATIDQHDTVNDFLSKLELHRVDLSCLTHCDQHKVSKQCKTNCHKTNKNRTSQCDTSRQDIKLYDANRAGAKTKGSEINPHKTKEHETTHPKANREEIRNEIGCCETKGNDTNYTETNPEKTKSHEGNDYETNGLDTNNETNYKKTKEDEMTSHKTKGWEINHETKIHETNHDETKDEESKDHQTNSLEIDHIVTNGQEMNRHKNNLYQLHDCQEARCRLALASEGCFNNSQPGDPVLQDSVDRPEPADPVLQDSVNSPEPPDPVLHDTTTFDNSQERCTMETTFEPAKRGDSQGVSHTNSGQPRKCVECDNTFVLTGLHACGDLSPTLLRVFVKCHEATALAVVTCCYMKLSSVRDPECGSYVGYPMSTFTSQLTNHQLSYEALEGACHFNDAYCRKLTNNSPELVSHAYRAALQEIISEKCPSMQHGSVRLTMRKAHHMAFKDYAEIGLRRLGLETDVSNIQLERAQMKLSRWREIVAFFTLRLCVLPVAETVVLLDRMLFLAQNGISSCLIPIFDPAISPRNFVLLATKGTSPR